ncbi:MAG: Mur ligase domain-containing protein, partial [Opitutaceae bacterium]
MIGYLSQNSLLISAFGSIGQRTRVERVHHERAMKEAPKLADYFEDKEIIASKGPLDRAISGLAIDSRRVVPGNLFFALPGLRADGAMYIDEAVSRGAVAVVTQQFISNCSVPQIRVNDAAFAASHLAHIFHGRPSETVR